MTLHAVRPDSSLEVADLVSRVLRDESIDSCADLRMMDLTQDQRQEVKALLRAAQSPVLACEPACGPG